MSKRPRAMKTDMETDAAHAASPAAFRGKETVLSVAAILILGLTAVTWFRGEAYAVAGYDFATSLKPLDDLARAMYLWDERLYAGSPNLLGIGTIPYFLLQHLSAAVAGSLYRGQMIFFTLLFVTPGLAMYLFARTIFSPLRDRNAMALLAAVFYMLNTFVVIKWNRGELITIFSYGLLPLYLALFERFLSRPTAVGLLLFNAVMFFYPVTLGHSADFIIITAVFASFALCSALFAGDIGRRGRRALLAAATALATGAWWVVPFVSGMVSGVAGVAGITSFTTGNLGLVDYYSSWATMLNVLKMWFFAMYPTSVEFATQFYRPGTLLFPIVAFSALLFARNRFVLFFALSALAGVWLAKGTHAPYPGLYEWMYLNVPYFFIFRAPTRYFPLIYVFCLTVLTGYSVVMMSRAIKKRLPSSRVLYRVPPAAVVALVFFHSWPLFSRDVIFRTAEGDVLYPSVFMELPSYYPGLNGWLGERDGYFRVHSFSNQAYLNYTWGYSSTDIAPKVLEVPQTLKFSQELIFGSPGFHDLMGAFDRTFWEGDFTGTAEVLGLLSVRYVTNIRDVMRRYLPHTNYYETVDAVLEGLPGLTPAVSMGPARVYENRFALPHIYASPKARVVEAGPASMRTLAAGGYLADLPAVVLARTGPAPDLPAEGRSATVVADGNVFDVVCRRLFGRFGFRPGTGSNGFRVEIEGPQLVWKRAARRGPGQGAVPEPVIAGLAGVPIAGEGLEGVSWKYLGIWDTSARGDYISVAEGASGEFVIVPRRVWVEELGRVKDESAGGVPWTRLFRVRNRVGPKTFSFYTGAGEYEVAVSAVPAFGQTEVAGFDEDYGASPGLSGGLDGWIFEKWADAELDGGVRISGAESFRAGKKISPGGGASGVVHGVDIEEFPYLAVDVHGEPAGFYEMDAWVWLDINGDGWPDGQIKVPVLRGGERAPAVDMTDLVKEKFGYPGRVAYRAVRVIFSAHRAPGAAGPAGAGGEGLSVTFRRLRFFRVDPVYGGGQAGQPPGVTVDGVPAGRVVSLGAGFHTLALAGEGEGEYDYLVKVSPATRARSGGAATAGGAGPGPEITWEKISPARYVARVRRTSGAPFWLVFNEGYNEGWRAYLRAATAGAEDAGELGRHIMVNGYANGWWVDNGGEDLEITLDYSPQRTMRAGAAASLSAAALLVVMVPVARRVGTRRGRDKEREGRS